MNDDLQPASDSRRSVTAHLELFVAEESDLVLAIAVADGHDCHDEQLLVSLDGVPIYATSNGHLCFLENVGRGLLLVDYQATVLGDAPRETETTHDVFQ